MTELELNGQRLKSNSTPNVEKTAKARGSPNVHPGILSQALIMNKHNLYSELVYTNWLVKTEMH